MGWRVSNKLCLISGGGMRRGPPFGIPVAVCHHQNSRERKRKKFSWPTTNRSSNSEREREALLLVCVQHYSEGRRGEGRGPPSLSTSSLDWSQQLWPPRPATIYQDTKRQKRASLSPPPVLSHHSEGGLDDRRQRRTRPPQKPHETHIVFDQPQPPEA